MNDQATQWNGLLLVRQASWEAEGVLGLTLVAPDGQPLPGWEPGAHIDVVLPSGLVRQYSLCGDPADRTAYRIAVLREEDGRGGSAEIHATNLVGRQVRVRGPRNNFRLEPADRYLFIAGGIGITPILPMIRRAEATSTPWRLVYGGRSRSSMAFLAEITSRSGGDIDLVPQDERGLPDLDAVLRAADPGTEVYSCGPGGMLQAVEECCSRLLSPGALHLERFAAGPVGPAPAEEAENTAFEVELRHSGVVLTVPADRTVLEVVREAVPSMLSSCEEGYCGTCETKVLDGTPDHRDSYLTPEEQEACASMMVCVSRAKTPRLVLDL
jgi:ferredoxin-NADP reductase